MDNVLEGIEMMLGEQRVVAMKAACRWLRERKVKEVMHNKGKLVEVPYTASLSHTMNALLANDVAAVPVAAPPNRWIGAGGSMILESDPVTGIVRKQYIGIVTMLDVLVHIAEEDGGIKVEGDHDPGTKLDRRMSVPVSSIIGHSLEGLSLWTLNPNSRFVCETPFCFTIFIEDATNFIFYNCYHFLLGSTGCWIAWKHSAKEFTEL